MPPTEDGDATRYGHASLLPGAIVTVFRSRRNEGALERYEDFARATEARLQDYEGLLEFKTFRASDDEWLSLVVFDSEDHQRAWRDDALHQAAQSAGREELYDQFEILVCELKRSIYHSRHPNDPKDRRSGPLR